MGGISFTHEIKVFDEYQIEEYMDISIKQENGFLIGLTRQSIINTIKVSKNEYKRTEKMD